MMDCVRVFIYISCIETISCFYTISEMTFLGILLFSKFVSRHSLHSMH